MHQYTDFLQNNHLKTQSYKLLDIYEWVLVRVFKCWRVEKLLLSEFEMERNVEMEGRGGTLDVLNSEMIGIRNRCCSAHSWCCCCPQNIFRMFYFLLNLNPILFNIIALLSILQLDPCNPPYSCNVLVPNCPFLHCILPNFQSPFLDT